MDVKFWLKWGAIIVVCLLVWRFLAGYLRSWGGGDQVPQIQSGASYLPPSYVPGVFGPIRIPYRNPFYSSPTRIHGRR